MIGADATATIGNTPLFYLRRISAGLNGQIIAKLEMRNPPGV